MAPYKPIKRQIARQLRREGLPVKRIAQRLTVSPASVSYWTKDIRLTREQRTRNLRGPHGPQNPERIARRAEAVRRTARARRQSYQEEGRLRAKDSDPLHLAGCMLYWAEGAKGRNGVKFSNSDRNMVVRFVEFLRDCMDIRSEQVTLRLNVYTNNGLTIRQIEDQWLMALDLPQSCVRKHQLNHYPTSSSGKRKRKLPYGVCTITVNDTRLVQHIYGAIQEYGGFEEPRWLDGPPRPSEAGRRRKPA